MEGASLTHDALGVLEEQCFVSQTVTLPGLKELAEALEAGVDELAHFTFAAVPAPPDRLARMVRQKVGLCPTFLDNVGKFVAAGGMVIYGTDRCRMRELFFDPVAAHLGKGLVGPGFGSALGWVPASLVVLYPTPGIRRSKLPARMIAPPALDAASLGLGCA